MKVILYFYIFFVIFNKSLCNTKEVDEGNILLPMKGSKIEITFEGKKIGNKNYYTTPLKVGTPEKIFNVQIDTSVSTCWLPSVKCRKYALSTILYNESESSTTSNPSNEEIELDDEDGDIEGYGVNDAISLNSNNLKKF